MSEKDYLLSKISEVAGKDLAYFNKSEVKPELQVKSIATRLNRRGRSQRHTISHIKPLDTIHIVMVRRKVTAHWTYY